MALVSGRFNLLAGASKRAEQTPAGGRSAKLPRAADILVEQGPRPAQAPRRLPASAPVDICIYKYTDQGADLWDLLDGKDGVPLYQIQIAHGAQNSVTFQMRDAFNDFLRATRAANNAMPATLKELETAASVRLVVTDRADPDDVGYVPWRVAFYATDISNFLLLLDGFWKFKARQLAQDQPFQVVVHPHTSIDLSAVWDELEYENYTLQENSATLPLHVFEAQPVVGKKITTLNLQVDGDTMISMIVTGHTWPWRTRLESFGISGCYYAEEANKGNEMRKYYRVWKDIDVSDDAQQQKFIAMLDGVFKNVAMRVSLDRCPHPDSPAGAFVENLRQRASLFFGADPAAPCAETQAERDSGGEDEQTQPLLY